VRYPHKRHLQQFRSAMHFVLAIVIQCAYNIATHRQGAFKMAIVMIDYTRSLAERAKARKSCGPYQWTPANRAKTNGRNSKFEGRGFYQSSHGMSVDARGSSFDLRLDYANTHHPINWRRSGTFSYEGQEFIAIIARLPNNRGFLAGFTMGEGMAASLDGYVWSNIEDAAKAAYDEAERACEAEAEYADEEEYA
jgi:hypothetical protein